MRGIILGPQRPSPNVQDVLEDLEVSPRQPVSVITAGWRHDEDELAALQHSIRRPIFHVPLYRWWEEICAASTTLARAHAERQDRIIRAKRLYRIRLRGALETVQRLQDVPEPDKDLLLHAQEQAHAALRRVDDDLLEEQATIYAAYPELDSPWELPGINARHREAKSKLNESGVLLIAGGHVAILLNRLRSFGIPEILEEWRGQDDHAVIAWSSGAMVLCERITLFYDDPPDGLGAAEVLDHGLGLWRGVMLFPHSRRRLRLDDAPRLRQLAARMAPQRCIGLENGAWLETDGESYTDRSLPGTSLQIMADGSIEEARS